MFVSISASPLRSNEDRPFGQEKKEIGHAFQSFIKKKKTVRTHFGNWAVLLGRYVSGHSFQFSPPRRRSEDFVTSYFPTNVHSHAWEASFSTTTFCPSSVVVWAVRKCGLLVLVDFQVANEGRRLHESLSVWFIAGECQPQYLKCTILHDYSQRNARLRHVRQSKRPFTLCADLRHQSASKSLTHFCNIL